MIRNYNGNVNRAVLRDLERLCDVNSENYKNLIDAYAEKGKVSFYTNVDPFTGCPDEMSEIRTLRSEEEILEYLKEDFHDRLTRYIAGKDTSDYLLSSLIEFIKESSGTFPNQDEMVKLEQTAEAKRIATQSVNSTTPSTITEQDVMKELLELAEEIMESRRKTKPEDIFVHIEPYNDELNLENSDLYACIEWNRYYGRGNNSDYTLSITLKETDSDLDDSVLFFLYHDDKVHVTSQSTQHEIKLTTDALIAIHRGIVKMAEQEGIQFTSEVNYKTLQRQ